MYRLVLVSISREGREQDFHSSSRESKIRGAAKPQSASLLRADDLGVRRLTHATCPRGSE